MDNILITSAGQRVSLLRFFQKELKSVSPDSKVFTVDANTSLSPACQVADAAFCVPLLSNDGYMESLKEICSEHEIKLIIPTIDTELRILASRRNELLDLGVDILVSDTEFIEICRDKRKTHVFFKDMGIKVPASIDKKNPTYPLFIKPYDGSLSKDIFKIMNSDELTDYHRNNEKFMFMELIDNTKFKEYTVDAYYNKNGSLICAIPRERIFVRGGEVNKSRTQKNILHDLMFSNLSYIKGARGCITIQFFLNEVTGDFYGIEINPRFGGGFPLSYHAGGNYPKWIIEEYLYGQKIAVNTTWKDGLLMLRYDDEIIVGRDD